MSGRAATLGVECMRRFVWLILVAARRLFGFLCFCLTVFAGAVMKAWMLRGGRSWLRSCLWIFDLYVIVGEKLVDRAVREGVGGGVEANT